uniref:PiggyBac transposable element-derived protein domain-containing protein n=1 Tax=Glossina morsitans morsitans TaxID=37546 RepID=A0A1B0F9G8_GLOMM
MRETTTAVFIIDRGEVLPLILSNVNLVDTGKIRRKKRSDVQERIIKPDCVIDYNQGMGSVDRQDQLLAYFPVMHKFVKRYKKIFFYKFDMALLNAHILHQKINKTKKTKYTNFRLNVAEELVKKVSLPNYNLHGRPSHSDAPLRLQPKNWFHFPEHIPPTANKQLPTKRCHVCAKHE